MSDTTERPHLAHNGLQRGGEAPLGTMDQGNLKKKDEKIKGPAKTRNCLCSGAQGPHPNCCKMAHPVSPRCIGFRLPGLAHPRLDTGDGEKSN